MTPAVSAAKRAGIEFEVLEYDASDAAWPWGTGAARAPGSKWRAGAVFNA